MIYFRKGAGCGYIASFPAGAVYKQGDGGVGWGFLYIFYFKACLQLATWNTSEKTIILLNKQIKRGTEESASENLIKEELVVSQQCSRDLGVNLLWWIIPAHFPQSPAEFFLKCQPRAPGSWQKSTAVSEMEKRWDPKPRSVCPCW